MYSTVGLTTRSTSLRDRGKRKALNLRYPATGMFMSFTTLLGNEIRLQNEITCHVREEKKTKKQQKPPRDASEEELMKREQGEL